MQSIIISKGTEDSRKEYLVKMLNSERDALTNLTTFADNINDPDLEVFDFIEGKSQISINQIRSLITATNFRPFKQKIKSLVINNADFLTTESSNALLKTLEEPPEYVRIVLLVNHHNNLLNTIKSRCILYELNDATPKTINSEHNFKAIDFLSADIGHRFDYLNGIKSILTSRENSIVLIKTLILELHEEILLQVKSTNSREKILKYKNAITLLKQVMMRIQTNNANTLLAFEYFAVNV